MAYAHEDGIRYATQFHPEHYYSSSNENAAYQKAWIDNFLTLACMHHDYRVNNGSHPINHYQQIQQRLDVCIKLPTCLDEGVEIVMNGEAYLNDVESV
jgi:hypothetical protein